MVCALFEWISRRDFSFGKSLHALSWVKSTFARWNLCMRLVLIGCLCFSELHVLRRGNCPCFFCTCEYWSQLVDFGCARVKLLVSRSYVGCTCGASPQLERRRAGCDLRLRRRTAGFPLCVKVVACRVFARNGHCPHRSSFDNLFVSLLIGSCRVGKFWVRTFGHSVSVARVDV